MEESELERRTEHKVVHAPDEDAVSQRVLQYGHEGGSFPDRNRASATPASPDSCTN